MQQIQMGKIQEKIDENKLILFLESLNNANNSTENKVVYKRKGVLDSSDDEDSDDLAGL